MEFTLDEKLLIMGALEDMASAMKQQHTRDIRIVINKFNKEPDVKEFLKRCSL